MADMAVNSTKLILVVTLNGTGTWFNTNLNSFRRIWGSHSLGYKELYLHGYNAV
jgi:hypothetical protein